MLEQGISCGIRVVRAQEGSIPLQAWRPWTEWCQRGWSQTLLWLIQAVDRLELSIAMDWEDDLNVVELLNSRGGVGVILRLWNAYDVCSFLPLAFSYRLHPFIHAYRILFVRKL